jgi:CheY-like chemotaxis protein
MPIVDGLTSTKMIRSHEKTTPSHKLSKRAALNSRVPIIAVSASLIEKDKQTYIDAGFDAWILKPISFLRLNELMNGIVDIKVRESSLYQPGKWEHGGWFDMPTSNRSSNTGLETGEHTSGEPSKGSGDVASAGDVQPKDDKVSKEDFATGKTNEDIFGDVDPSAKESKNKSMPHLRRPGDFDEEAVDVADTDETSTSIFPGQEVASPKPIE